MNAESAPKRILLVEDDHELRESVVDLLSEEGFRVSAAKDGLEALTLLAREPRPHIILLDLMMPKMNGAEFRKRQLEDSDYSSIPVVVLTAHGIDDGERETFHADGFIKKPFEISFLLEVIDDVFRRTL